MEIIKIKSKKHLEEIKKWSSPGTRLNVGWWIIRDERDGWYFGHKKYKKDVEKLVKVLQKAEGRTFIEPKKEPKGI